MFESVAVELIVRCADNERGNEVMEKLAKEYAKLFPEADLITVHEHSGWYLTYGRVNGGPLRVVGSANDCAVYDREISEWRRKTGRKKRVIVESIRRSDRSDPIFRTTPPMGRSN